jgi:transposase
MGTYPQEFKDQLVEFHRQGRSFIDLSREFNVSATSIANWAKSAERREADQAVKGARRRRIAARLGEVVADVEVEVVVEPDQVRIARLERELAMKAEEVEILGKALAFFVKRSER